MIPFITKDRAINAGKDSKLEALRIEAMKWRAYYEHSLEQVLDKAEVFPGNDFQWSALCTYSTGRHCSDCPLFKIGQRCRDKRSMKQAIDKSLYIFVHSPTKRNFKHFQLLCYKMFKAVAKLYYSERVNDTT
jgi:hypothetical protein